MKLVLHVAASDHKVIVIDVLFVMQAQLVAQLLCCIPLTSVEPVLTWLTSAMPQCEQKDLLLQVIPLFIAFDSRHSPSCAHSTCRWHCGFKRSNMLHSQQAQLLPLSPAVACTLTHYRRFLRLVSRDFTC